MRLRGLGWHVKPPLSSGPYQAAIEAVIVGTMMTLGNMREKAR